MANLQAILQAISQQRDLKQRKRETSLGVLQTGIEGLGKGIGARRTRAHETEQSELDRILERGGPKRTAEANVWQAEELQTAGDERLLGMYPGKTLAEAMQILAETQAMAADLPEREYKKWLMEDPLGILYQEYEERIAAAGRASLDIDTGDVNERMQRVIGTYGEHWFEPDSMNPLDLAALRADFEKEAANDKDPEGMMRAFDRWFGTAEGEQPVPIGEDAVGVGGTAERNLFNDMYRGGANTLMPADYVGEEVDMVAFIKDLLSSGEVEDRAKLVQMGGALGGAGQLDESGIPRFTMEKIRQALSPLGYMSATEAPVAEDAGVQLPAYQPGAGRIEQPTGTALPLSRTPPKKESEIERLLREKGR